MRSNNNNIIMSLMLSLQKIQCFLFIHFHFSKDKENDTLEFNEYLTMLGLQNIEQIQYDSLLEALRFENSFCN